MLTSPAAQPAEVSQPTPPQQKQDVNSKGMTQTDIMIALGMYRSFVTQIIQLIPVSQRWCIGYCLRSYPGLPQATTFHARKIFAANQ